MNITKCMSALTVARERIDAAMAGLGELSTLITGQVSSPGIPATAATAARKVGKASHTRKRTFSPEQRAVMSAAAKERWAKKTKQQAATKKRTVVKAAKPAAGTQAPIATTKAA